MKRIILIGILILIFIAGYFTGKARQPKVVQPTGYDISVQIAKQTTVLRPSYMTASEIDNYFKGTPLYGYGKDLLIAEEKSGIGADILAAILAHESAYGHNAWTSNYCHNPFSWGIYKDSDGVVRCHIPYNSVEGCIIGEWRHGVWHDGVPVLIKKLYLTKGAPYYSGETLYAIGTHYASDGSWYQHVEYKLSHMPKSETTLAKEWAVGSKIFKPFDKLKGIEEPKYYWTQGISKVDFARILYRVNNK